MIIRQAHKLRVQIKDNIRMCLYKNKDKYLITQVLLGKPKHLSFS